MCRAFDTPLSIKINPRPRGGGAFSRYGPGVTGSAI
nr:MAG TPA: hypothetical protein [Caudoviricetes sp.]